LDAQLLIAMLSLTVAVAAVIVAVAQVRRAAQLASHANQISVVNGLISEFRSPTFRAALHAIDRQHDSPPDNGFAGLGPAADSAYTACYLFEYLGQLVTLRSISEDIVLSLMATHILKVWHCLEPFIIGERHKRDRELTPGVPRRFLPHFEHLVSRILERRRADGSINIDEVPLRTLAGPLAAPSVKRADGVV